MCTQQYILYNEKCEFCDFIILFKFIQNVFKAIPALYKYTIFSIPF